MIPLHIHQFPYDIDDNYGVLLHSSETGETACIDCGITQTYQAALAEKGWQLSHLLITHHHYDHVNGVVGLKKATGCKVIGPDYNYKGGGKIQGIDQHVKDGDRFEFAGHEVQVLHTPGHTMDLICYYFPAMAMIFVGDTLFAMGCGKAFEGTATMIWDSLKKLHALPPETMIYCSHEYTQENVAFALSVDPENPALQQRSREVDELRERDIPTVPFTLATELATNPFLRANDAGIRAHLNMVDAPEVDVFIKLRELRG